jgi:hydrogenase expression/formation protein HypE
MKAKRAVDKILLGHGSGGRMMHKLVAEYFAPAFSIKGISDSAVLDGPGEGRIAVTTDSYVVSPLFFPGGNIGDLAVNGTVNDLLMVGARPLYITAGFIIEEGMPLDQLRQIVTSMAEAADMAGVRIVAGDTKVVDRGKGDGIFINTSGIGMVPPGIELSASGILPGDRIILSGSIARHGIAVMSKRNGLSFDPPVTSDTCALTGLVGAMIGIDDGAGIRVMRDPTRGGMATTLKEFALESGLCMTFSEDHVPVEPGVKGACELLGLDPLYVANEGILLAVASPDVAEYLVDGMKQHPFGHISCIIGEVDESPGATVLMKTLAGGNRIVDMLQAEQLPRIC